MTETSNDLLAAGYWPQRTEEPTASASRLLGFMAAVDSLFPDAGPWETGMDSEGGPVPIDVDGLAQFFAERTTADGAPATLSGALLRQGALAAHFIFGTRVPNSSDHVLVYPRGCRGAAHIVTAVVENFAPAWAIFAPQRLRSAQRPKRMPALIPWLGAVTYLPGHHQAPEGATATPLGDGTLIDFTQGGTVEPDDATILAAVDQVLPPAG